MTKTSSLFLGLSLAASCIPIAAAQDPSLAPMKPPKYLQVTVEYTKPGKGGLAHDKTESAFVQAMIKAKYPIHYWAYNSMSGHPRAIFISGFDSFGELGNANKIFDNPAVAAAFEPLNVADGELLSDTNQLILSYADDISLRPDVDLFHHRFLEADILHVRQGHVKEFIELAKMWVAIGQKAGPSAHWDCFRDEYGDDNGYFVCLTPDNSMDDIDAADADFSKAEAGLSDEEKSKIRDLRGAALEEDRTEIYYVNPAQSYVPESFIKADPAYWGPKTGAAAKPAAKKTTP